MKKVLKNLKKSMKKNQVKIQITILSILALIVGTLAIGFKKAILIVGCVDLVILIASLISKKKNRKTNKKASEKKEKKKMSKKKKIIIIASILSFFTIIFIAGTTVVVLFLQMIVRETPEFDESKLYSQNASILYYPNGEIMKKLGSQMREKITYDQIPEVLIDAIVATEDSRFFQHNGFDLPRFLIASVKQVLGKSDAGGASTLTMQISKNQFTSTEDEGIEGIKRKFTDIYMSMYKIEQNYTKEQIMEFYVNTYYMGGGAHGVEQASQTYFKKSAKELNLAEAAMLAGMFQAPGYYDPYKNPERAENRRKIVLYLMERHGYITADEKAIAEQLTVDKILVHKDTDSSESDEYQGFIDTVVAQVVEDTGMDPYVVPMEIYTTINREKQDYVNKIMSGEIFAWENDIVQSGISVLDSKTGAIIAIGNGRHQTDAKSYNYATMIKNQIGSTAKPLFDYATGIEYENWSPAKLYGDEPYTYTNGPEVKNWDTNYHGLLTMREALSNSWNIPALKSFQQNKNSNIREFVTKLGLSPEISGGSIHEAHSIGGYTGESPLTLSAAYAAFANGGYYIKPYSYTKIIFRETGEVREYTPTKVKVMSEETAYIMADLLKSTAPVALSPYHTIGTSEYGAKTGTSNFSEATINQWHLSKRAVNDLWVAAITPEYSLALWYGYDHIDPEHYSLFGITEQKKLFQVLARGIFTNTSAFVKPAGVVEVEIEKGNVTPMLPSEYTPADMRITELFKSGTEPTEISPRFDKANNITNLDYKIEKNKIKLTWDAAPIKDSLNREKVTEQYRTLYTDDNYLAEAVNMYMAYNDSAIGNIVYNVYQKNQDGSLKLLTTTTDTSYEQIVSAKDTTATYIVKTSYSILSVAESTGTEITANLNNVESVITAELKGKEKVEMYIGETYKDPKPSVIILEDLVDVTKNAKITTIIKTKDGKTITTIPSDKEATYIITYSIEYNDYKTTLTRTVNYIKKSGANPNPDEPNPDKPDPDNPTPDEKPDKPSA